MKIKSLITSVAVAASFATVAQAQVNPVLPSPGFVAGATGEELIAGWSFSPDGFYAPTNTPFGVFGWAGISANVYGSLGNDRSTVAYPIDGEVTLNGFGTGASVNSNATIYYDGSFGSDDFALATDDGGTAIPEATQGPGTNTVNQNIDLDRLTDGNQDGLDDFFVDMDPNIANPSALGFTDVDKAFVIAFATEYTFDNGFVASFADINLSYAHGGTSTITWEYSTDGVNFNAIGGSALANAGAAFNLKTLDLSAIDAIEGQANVFLRGTLSGNSGQTLLDNIQIVSANGNVVPEPSTYGVIAAGLLAAVAIVRRRRRA